MLVKNDVMQQLFLTCEQEEMVVFIKPMIEMVFVSPEQVIVG